MISAEQNNKTAIISFVLTTFFFTIIWTSSSVHTLCIKKTLPPCYKNNISTFWLSEIMLYCIYYISLQKKSIDLFLSYCNLDLTLVYELFSYNPNIKKKQETHKKLSSGQCSTKVICPACAG